MDDKEFKKLFEDWKKGKVPIDLTTLTKKQILDIVVYKFDQYDKEYHEIMATIQKKVDNGYIKDKNEDWGSCIPEEESGKLHTLFWNEGYFYYLPEDVSGEILYTEPLIEDYADAHLREVEEEVQKMIEKHHGCSYKDLVEDTE